MSISKTNLVIQFERMSNVGKYLTECRLKKLSFELLSILLGFFTSTALSTIPAQTGDWGIAAAAIIVCSQEVISKINYRNYTSISQKINIALKTFLRYCNSIKIGILYGLFVDAFKLGS